jgi:hypothetical protein
VWFVILAITAGIYFATGDFLLGSLLPYVWVAWPSVESAFWLRSRDPVQERGKTCFWFYLSAAGWRAAISALLTVAAFALIDKGAGIPVNMDELARTMIVFIVGLGVSSLLGISGTICAFRRRVRVFVIPNLKRLCRGDFDAIPKATQKRRVNVNWAIFVLMTSVFVPVLTAGLLTAMLSATARPPNAPASTAESAGLAILCLGPIAALIPYSYLATRIAASTPWNCWPDVFAAGNEEMLRSGDAV